MAGSGGSPSSWIVRRARATSASAAGSRSSSEVTPRPSTNRVTIACGLSTIAATGGAIPASAARSFAIRSASRSISSSDVSLPGTRIT